MDVAGILSIDKGLATTIVNAVDLMGWVFVGASVILAIVSAGTLAAASLSVDALIFTIKDFLKRNLKAQAIAW